MDLFLHRCRPPPNRPALTSYPRREKSQSQQKSHQISSVNRFAGSANLGSAPHFKTVEQNKRTTVPHRMGKGLNDHFLYLRKENHLNTCFNIRKNKLKEMTRANKQLFQKLTSQKSIYNSDDMNKSYQSIK